MDNDVEENSSTVIEYRTYRWRFIILLMLLLLQVSVSFQMQEFSSIANVVADYYDVNYLAVDWLGLSGIVLTMLAFYPLTYACEKYGIRSSITVSAFLCAFGACLKCMALRRNFFWFIFIGQMFQSFSFQISLYIMPTVASVWFKSEESATVISVSQVAISLGFALSFLPSMLIFKYTKADEEIRNGFCLVLIPVAVISVALFLLILMLVRDKPPTPPSASQKLREIADYSWRDLLKNSNFYYLSISFSLLVTCNQALLLTLNQSVLSEFTHGETQLSIAGFLLSGSAFLGTIIVKILTKKILNYKIMNIIISVFGALLITSFIGSLWLKSEILLYLALFVFGICRNTNCAIVVDFMFEVTYPFPSGTVYGISFAINAIFAITCTQLVTILMNNFGAVNANYVLLVNYLIIISLSLLVSEDYRRRKANSITKRTISTENLDQ
ncbi:hypothetical protein B4U79_17445 [Dinothrombium tinctorium]|uniref:Feline leukemia virus subgroup C receptor-related protein 2-like protein n=1 Tax=Dinothrombium tinctorium TaxID=1965070 RepID=A0A3S3P6T6_9ACAR|nr:hypothetical protein B4U79_13042 [Dinothrombium tinctorium]RWS06494.1 hypothetical protein B4U79_16207 [Dinothrombium tinctorium]RWS12565.1 hypothetical protein B4U79_17445 [Dinothrombium tinctorium]